MSTVLVDGTDIATATRFEEDKDGYYALPPLRGDLPTFPGVDGETNADQPFGSFVFPQHLILSNASVAAANDEFRTLKRLCKPGATVTLTKRTTFGSGDEDVTATAKLHDIQRSRINPVVVRCVVEWSILSGVWYATSTSSVSLVNGANTPTITGEVRTKNMTVTLTGGTTPSLVNSTTGHALTFTGSMGSPVTINVLNGTATQSATDVSDFLTHTQVLPFALAPGSNSITLSGGGSASITYTPAY